MKTILPIVLLISAVLSPLFAVSKQDVEAQRRELEVLKQYLAEARDSLQDDIARRWRKKQRYVEQRELDKEEIARLRERQEQAFSELSQLKEEAFSRERILEDTRKEYEETEDKWTFVVSSFSEVFDKEAKLLPEVNPLFMEERRQKLEAVRREYRQQKSPARILPAVLEYYTGVFTRNRHAWAGEQVVMPDEGDPSEMQIVSFGGVLAYALTENGDPYMVRQTGKLGAGRYAVEHVGAPELAQFIQEQLPGWMNAEKIGSPVRLDVMQNANSGILVSGKKVRTSTRIAQWFKSGGPVMIPLVGLMLWAVVLVVLKIVQFRKKHRANHDLYSTVLDMLRKNEMEQARAYSKGKKGVVAQVVTACLEHSQWNRASAEKAVREILVEESPLLNKHLATLAVIAGSAPLLGLLGTVTGMINLFEVITHYGTGDPKILAGGISEALVTTQTGLAIAIPILLVHNFLRNESNHIHSEVEKHALRILNRLWPESGAAAR